MSSNKVRTKKAVILETWLQCGSDSVGTEELRLIQERLQETFGQGAVDSPASLARTLADSGACLRHPDILEADATWRESRTYELFGSHELVFDSLEAALALMSKLEEFRGKFSRENDPTGLQIVVEHAREIKMDLSAQKTDLANELVSWLTIWLQTPDIFTEWLSLRRNSSEFLKKFAS